MRNCCVSGNFGKAWSKAILHFLVLVAIVPVGAISITEGATASDLPSCVGQTSCNRILYFKARFSGGPAAEVYGWLELGSPWSPISALQTVPAPNALVYYNTNTLWPDQDHWFFVYGDILGGAADICDGLTCGQVPILGTTGDYVHFDMLVEGLAMEADYGKIYSSDPNDIWSGCGSTPAGVCFYDFSTTNYIFDNNPDSTNLFHDNGGFVCFVPAFGQGCGQVPEPLTLSLFGAGLGGAVAVRRRKKAA